MRNFRQKYFFCQNFFFLHWNFDVFPQLWFLTKIPIFAKNFIFDQKFQFLTEISIFVQFSNTPENAKNWRKFFPPKKSSVWQKMYRSLQVRIDFMPTLSHPHLPLIKTEKFWGYFGRKFKFWTKIEILDENKVRGKSRRSKYQVKVRGQSRRSKYKVKVRGLWPSNFGQKFKFWAKIEIWGENLNFGRKLKFWVKIEILDENWNFWWELKFWTKIEILDENWNCGLKLKFWTKIEILD